MKFNLADGEIFLWLEFNLAMAEKNNFDGNSIWWITNKLS